MYVPASGNERDMYVIGDAAVTAPQDAIVGWEPLIIVLERHAGNPLEFTAKYWLTVPFTPPKLKLPP